jgi:hypothetical protein
LPTQEQHLKFAAPYVRGSRVIASPALKSAIITSIFPYPLASRAIRIAVGVAVSHC